MLKKQRNLTEKCKKSFIGWKLPHTYVILTIILRVIDPANGKTIVLPDSFHFVEGNRPDFFDIFLSVSRGYVSAADILFLIVFAYGFVYVLKDNGTLDAAVSALLKLMGKRTELLIPVGMLLFGMLGSTLGIFEETYGLVPLFASIMLAPQRRSFMGVIVRITSSGVIIPSGSGEIFSTSNPSDAISSAGWDTAWCSTAEIAIAFLPRSAPNFRQMCNAALSLSLPPDVKITSSGSQFTISAIAERADSTAFFAASPIP